MKPSVFLFVFISAAWLSTAKSADNLSTFPSQKKIPSLVIELPKKLLKNSEKNTPNLTGNNDEREKNKMSHLQFTTDKEFAVGQIYSYETRPGEEASQFTVVSITHDMRRPSDIILAIYIGGLKIKDPHSPTKTSSSISHIPISREAVKKSKIRLVKTVTSLPNFQEGFDAWKEAYDQGDAGVFSITIKKAVDFMEQALNRN